VLTARVKERARGIAVPGEYPPVEIIGEPPDAVPSTPARACGAGEVHAEKIDDQREREQAGHLEVASGQHDSTNDTPARDKCQISRPISFGSLSRTAPPDRDLP